MSAPFLRLPGEIRLAIFDQIGRAEDAVSFRNMDKYNKELITDRAYDARFLKLEEEMLLEFFAKDYTQRTRGFFEYLLNPDCPFLSGTVLDFYQPWESLVCEKTASLQTKRACFAFLIIFARKAKKGEQSRNWYCTLSITQGILKFLDKIMRGEFNFVGEGYDELKDVLWDGDVSVQSDCREYFTDQIDRTHALLYAPVFTREHAYDSYGSYPVWRAARAYLRRKTDHMLSDLHSRAALSGAPILEMTPSQIRSPDAYRLRLDVRIWSRNYKEELDTLQSFLLHVGKLGDSIRAFGN
ncbi:hypothetical protein BJ508DRAFT_331045 [Ascobolus immersus RN42]|uniref:Uncharacterized protein n=1 Tax=Ascobolus immersus RN42 TaxID=1160509 RepID=A0A3N4HTY4_ASCIM|nr:hypothetical protein BJ508DRAFT_331045 [Ascobolus immersus RN42]